MVIAVDKNSFNAAKKDNEYIYLFDDEPLQELLDKKMHCVNYKLCGFVDINLTDFDIDCIKKAKVGEENFDKLPEIQNYNYAIIVPNFNNNHGDYNGKTYLRNCIESVLNQTYTNFDLIIVDDLSTDNSIQAIKSYNDKRIHLVKNIRKRYNGGSRNAGIEYALQNLNCDYFCFLDSDDWWKHNKVLEHINYKLYGHEMMIIGSEMLFPNGATLPQYNKFDNYEDIFFSINKVWCTAWSRVIRKDKIAFFCEDTLMEDRVWSYKQADNINFDNVTRLKEICYVWNRLNTTNSVSMTRGDFWNASAYCHIGHQLQLLSQLKHEEMKPILEKRINECIKKINSGTYQQY